LGGNCPNIEPCLADLLWFIDGCNDGLDTKWHVLVVLVTTKQEADALVAGLAPVVKEPLHQHWVVKLNVVHVTVFLVKTTPTTKCQPTTATFYHPQRSNGVKGVKWKSKKFHSSNIQNGLPFWRRLTQAVLEKRQLNGCSTTTTTVLWPFFPDHPGEPVPEENFWTLWCKGRLIEADTPTIRLGATPSGLASAHLHYPPIFTGWMPFLPPNQQCQSTEGKLNGCSSSSSNIHKL